MATMRCPVCTHEDWHCTRCPICDGVGRVEVVDVNGVWVLVVALVVAFLTVLVG